MSERGPLATTMRRLLALLVAALAGVAIAKVLGLHDVEHSPVYFYAATALLAVGLYGSTHGIDLADVRVHLRIVLVAVTVGVLAKAALIATVMFFVFDRRPEYLVLGVAVAQIDPLSTAAMTARSRLSERAKSILAAWSSFDDPITMLLTIYVSAIALDMTGRDAAAGVLANAGFWSFGQNLLLNAAFAAVVGLLWLAVSRIPPGVTRVIVQIVLLCGALVVGVMYFLMLGVALIGLVVRPPIELALARAVQFAYVVAAVGLGVVLLAGVNIVPGVVLGLTAFFAQVLVGLLVTTGLVRKDRTYLSFAQQNGITAIILALLLEPDFPGTVGVVAPAILVVNTLHGLFTGFCDRYGERMAAALTGRRPSPVPPSAPEY